MNEDVTIQAWAARDRNGILCYYKDKPEKDKEGYRSEVWASDGPMIEDDEDMLSLPSVKWEDIFPTPVEITIKVKR